jgi:hypothetical protein
MKTQLALTPAAAANEYCSQTSFSGVLSIQRQSFRKIVLQVSVITGLIFLPHAAKADAGDLNFNYPQDTPQSFSFSATHGEFTASKVYNLTGGKNWVWSGTLDQVNGTFKSDKINISGTLQHILPPGGGQANPNVDAYTFKTNSNDYKAGPGAAEPLAKSVPYPGKGTDDYLATLAFTVTTGAIVGFTSDFTSYIHVVSGVFVPPGRQARALFATPMGSQEVASVTTNAYGSMNFFIYPDDGTFDLSLAALGINPSDVTAVDLDLGAPGSTGSVIENLGTSFLTAIPGGGISGEIQGILPTADITSVLEGDTYVNISTFANPTGEIRGQILGVVPEPSTWAMMLLGFAGLGFAGYRQARKIHLASA